MEVYFNDFSTTVAIGGYTAGSGFLNVAATSPITIAAGDTTRLTIYDVSNNVVVILIATAVNSSTQFAVTAEGADANATAGQTVLNTLTVGAMDQIKADVGRSSGFYQTLTPLIAGDFSDVNFNTGSGVVTNRVDNTSPVNSTTLCQSDPSATMEIAAVDKSPINAAFTVTLAFSFASGVSSMIAGLWLSDGSAVNLFFGVNTGGFLTATVLSNFGGTFGVNVLLVATNPVNGLFWVRIQETASARNYYISSDGINFFLVATESNTAHFTTAKYGFGLDCRAAGLGVITAYSFTETTP
jgi:hypothetical protein